MSTIVTKKTLILFLVFFRRIIELKATADTSTQLIMASRILALFRTRAFNDMILHSNTLALSYTSYFLIYSNPSIMSYDASLRII